MSFQSVSHYKSHLHHSHVMHAVWVEIGLTHRDHTFLGFCETVENYCKPSVAHLKDSTHDTPEVRCRQHHAKTKVRSFMSGTFSS